MRRTGTWCLTVGAILATQPLHAGGFSTREQTNPRGQPGGVASSASSLFGDYTGDGDVDLQDYSAFHTCSRLGPEVVASGCGGVDSDFDLDIDLRDVAALQRSFTGPLVAGPCGNHTRNLGEHCDDGNTLSGDGCSSICRLESPNDSCTTPILVGDGTITYSNVGASTDGPNEPERCGFFGYSQVDSDVWYCYRASCTGSIDVSLCGSEYDTKLAVYKDCVCPTAIPLSCSDDDCGTATVNIQSRVSFMGVAGETYLVRAGGFVSEQGPGQLTVRCGADPCNNAVSDCFAPSPSGGAGCEDSACCTETCAVDRFCCDVTWDDVCADEALGLCTGNFPACTSTAGSCTSVRVTPGCSNLTCCNTVCRADPYCCLQEWDTTCVNEAASMCR